VVVTPHQRAWWRAALELKLRKSSGDSFQDFFSRLMEMARGSDFVRVRPYGALGDKGCDGYLQSSGEVFQCYGAINSVNDKVAYLIGKMESDFGTAKAKLPGLMKKWTLVHNLVDGLPIHAIQKRDQLQKDNPGIEAKELFALPTGGIEDLLGLAAQAEDFLDLQAEELRELVNEIVMNNHGRPRYQQALDQYLWTSWNSTHYLSTGASSSKQVGRMLILLVITLRDIMTLWSESESHRSFVRNTST
jgi:hypothetical protein